MSEYWISKKKYFCKYCDIYIADDAPSRQQHEGGLRHKGNVERFIRGIYKAGEKKKKDLEEEKREMARAARAAFAQDVSLGHAKASSAPVASTSSAPPKPAAKPSNPFTNYSTADQLGFKDPDAEHLEIRKSQGLVGDWQIIESTPAPLPSDAIPEEDIKPELVPGFDPTIGGDPGGKRIADAPPDDDVRSFKLRRKTATAVLGDIYDPGLIPIKVKKKEGNSAAPDPSTSSTVPSTSTSATEVPKWTAISLKPKDSSSRASPPPSPATKKKETSNLPPLDNNSEQQQLPPVGSRWAKVQWGQATEGEVAAIVSQPTSPAEVVTRQECSEPPIRTGESGILIKTELDTPDPPAEPEQPATGLFKKRKVPIGGRGRR